MLYKNGQGREYDELLVLTEGLEVKTITLDEDENLLISSVNEARTSNKLYQIILLTHTTYLEMEK